MDWLSPHGDFVDGDLNRFQFQQESSFMVKTVKIHIDQNGKAKFDPKNLTSEQAYRSWIRECRSLGSGSPPTMLLAMHERLPDRQASSVPYGKETLSDACKGLLQHRSLSFLLRRTSHAVFNKSQVRWNGREALGPSTVYNCRSDTTCQTGKSDDILMSVTSFPDIPLTFGVMYGCTEQTMKFVLQYLDNLPRPALHPLMIPMMFLELERTRLLEALREKAGNLTQRILEMENRLSNFADEEETVKQQNDASEKDVAARNAEQDKTQDKMLQKDCQATNDWVLVSGLKNGLQSLIAVVGSMTEHSHNFREENETDTSPTAGNRRLYTGNTEKFQARLKEMDIELQSEVRKCEGLLGSMALATQMVITPIQIVVLSLLIPIVQEWNFHTRRDARANIYIAYASKMDSSQMKYISLLGMVFLPGTFLATLFSMTFFNWIPDESPQVVSPWIVLWFGSAALLTSITYWKWKRYIAEQRVISHNDIQKRLKSDRSFTSTGSMDSGSISSPV
ncbi:hypothetical protein PG984_006622 [Apiospora sp. TS-2023a]